MMRVEDGTIRLVVQALERIQIRQFVQTEPYLIARVERAPELAAPWTETDALVRTLRSLFERLVGLNIGIPKELSAVVQTMNDPTAMAYVIAAAAPLSSSSVQQIFEFGPS